MIVDDVSKHLGGRPVLGRTNWELPAGRTSVLIGPSGCGKTTLLKIMVGLLRPDTGIVRVGQKILDANSVWELRRRFGYVIQEGGLFPHLTAMGNMTLMARHLDWTADRIEQRVEKLVQLTQFPADGLTRFPAELSGGQRQRVSLMRALFLDPDYLFLDEPLGALDPLIRADLQNDLKQIFAKLKKTVVMVTHDLHEAVFFADEIALMNEGNIIQRGTAGDLVSRPATPFVERFIRAQQHAAIHANDAGTEASHE